MLNNHELLKDKKYTMFVGPLHSSRKRTDIVKVAMVIIGDMLPGSATESLCQKLNPSNTIPLSPTLEDITDVAKVDSGIVYVSASNDIDDMLMAERLRCELTSAWDGYGRVDIRDVLSAWLPDHRLVVQRHHVSGTPHVEVLYVAAPDVELSKAASSELAYLIKNPSKYRESAVKMLLKGNGVPLVTTNMESPISKVAFAEEIRSYCLGES